MAVDIEELKNLYSEKMRCEHVYGTFSQLNVHDKSIEERVQIDLDAAMAWRELMDSKEKYENAIRQMSIEIKEKKDAGL